MPKGNPTKKCCRCDHFKPFAQFDRSYKSKDGHRSACKPCRAKAQRFSYLHYAQAFDRRKLPKEKKCSRCVVVRPRAEFTLSRSSRDGLDYVCRKCKAELHAEYREHSKVWLKNQRLCNLWNLYRLSGMDYELLLEAQKHVCAICEQDMGERPFVDHCHDSGKTRGLLCNKCNSALGSIEKSGFLEKALRYLEKHK